MDNRGSPDERPWILLKKWYDGVDNEYEVRTNGLKVRVSKTQLSKKIYEVILVIETDGVVI